MIKQADSETLKKRVEEYDLLHLDVTERAEKVNAFIMAALGLVKVEELVKQPLYWDLVSFATEFLNGFAFAMAEEDVELLTVAKLWNSKIHSMHYAQGKNSPSLGPSREEHINIWNSRIEEF